jgi:hypothetical protein
MSGTNTVSAPQTLAPFRALVHRDAAVQAALQAVDEADDFAALCLRLAQQHGLALDEAELATALKPDPLGIARLMAPAAPGPDLPPAGWLPVAVDGQVLAVEWLHFGAQRLLEPFFEDSIRRARRRPFNRLMHYRTTLEGLAQWTGLHPGLPPRGFVFHMSRCGSTLVAQMLAAVDSNVVISEAAPLDAVVQLGQAGYGAGHAALLAQMVGALAQPRRGGESHAFVKLDSWHTLALPLFRQAFPDVPWVFLYRDPVEVLASQVMQRGAQTVPEFVHPSFYGIDAFESMAPEEYCAHVLKRTCEAVMAPLAEGGGLLVNYRDLPEALFTQILPHFGIAPSQEERAAMQARTAFDAKTPMLSFSAGEDRAQKAKIAKAREAGRILDGVYAELERLRLTAAAN